MDINAVYQALSNAFSIVIISSLIVAVGFGLIGGLAWLYIQVGKYAMIFIRKAYFEAMDAAAVTKGKKVKV